MHFKLMLRNVSSFIANSGGANPSDARPISSAATIENQAQLQAKVARFRLEHHLPGLAVALVQNDTIYHACSGQRRIDAPDLIQSSDHFPLGALGKAVTATLIASLIAQGKIRWDATLAELLPAWREQMLAQYQSLTITQLLQHRAGLARDFCDMNYPSLLAILGGNHIADRITAARWLLQQPLTQTANQKRSYSNLGYLIASIIAELRGGDTYENLLEQYVFQPLNINAHFGASVLVQGHRWISTGYLARPKWQIAKNHADDQQQLCRLNASSEIKLSLPDYGVFLREHLRGLRGQSTLLNAACFKRLHTPNDHYALGWSVIQSPQYGPISVHDSAAGGYSSYALMMPRHNTAVAVICNGENSRTASKLIQLAESLAT
ncbi:serine hydrolase domain-containing protein [Deefgea rivuli]|uniref:serine hydrolase domain-containing protein n=1 Tax=Deefgea rivuli TaxID=400948 RepID=UPI00048246FA|nr:serine hydrolase domain-containing protein [Deefgea rivuli]